MNAPSPEALTDLPQGKIVLFDAECVLCTANAKLILTQDKHQQFYLASMQGKAGAALYREHGIDPTDPDTLLVIERDTVRRNSDAVLTIYSGLGFPWNLSRIFKLIPRALRDPLYLLIARNRYRLFGKRETCWMAPPEYRARILE